MNTTPYESIANEFLQIRDNSQIGAKIVRQWANQFPKGTNVLEVACGGGYPISRELVHAGLNLWAIDSSPSLVEKFKSRFPKITVKSESMQDSDFFGRKFDAAIAVGFIFLLQETEQSLFIEKVSSALKAKGKLLFSAPSEACVWQDINTGMDSLSLGYEEYEKLLTKFQFRIISTYVDKGKNHYYSVEKIR